MIGGDDELRSMQDQLARTAREREQNLFGVYRGKVSAVGTGTSGKESRLGQLQVHVPEIWGSNSTNLPWADPVVPFAGDGYGALMLPKVGDGVCVMFEGGSRHHPVWLGAFWSENAARPSPAAEQVRVIVSPNKHMIVIDDSSDELRLEHKSGNKITINNDGITLEVKNGGKIVVSSSGIAVNDTALTVDK